MAARFFPLFFLLLLLFFDSLHHRLSRARNTIRRAPIIIKYLFRSSSCTRFHPVHPDPPERYLVSPTPASPAQRLFDGGILRRSKHRGKGVRNDIFGLSLSLSLSPSLLPSPLWRLIKSTHATTSDAGFIDTLRLLIITPRPGVTTERAPFYYLSENIKKKRHCNRVKTK